MRYREDGRKTRERILKAACEVFAERGYRGAKVADICRRAGVNIASVNYYFGGKASLYTEVWRETFRNYAVPIPAVSKDLTPEERLGAHIRSFIQNFADEGSQGRFTRLYLMELVHPTGLIQELWLEMIEPRRRVLLDLIREIAGEGISSEEVLFCEMSVINQCRTLLTVRREDIEYLMGQPLTPEWIQRLADHITRFSLAGIRAVGKKGNTVPSAGGAARRAARTSGRGKVC